MPSMRATRSSSIFATFCAVAFAAGVVNAAERPPNVIIFLADDLGWSDVSMHGSKIETPSIDRIAAEGVELTRFYSAPICSPTRAALMTGRDPMRLGISYGVVMPWSNNGVHPHERFIAQAFSDAGYQTAITGKWHLGHSQDKFTPRRRGFDHFYGHLHTEVGYFPPFGAQGGKDLQRNGETLDDEGWEPWLVSDEAVDWIRGRDKERPFFLYMPYLSPHTPLDAPQELQDKYADLDDDRAPARSTSDWSRWMKYVGIKSLRQMYAAVVDGMDQGIGRVLDVLDEEGIANDTIVIVLSDNGGQVTFGAGGAENAPYRGGKAETFEGGIRVVAAMRWPGKIEADSEMGQIMTVMDIFPTLMAATGIEPGEHKPFDGLDMWDAVAKKEEVSRDDYVYFASEVPRPGSLQFTAFDEDWKLVQHIEQDFSSTTVTNLLFHISEDPYEFTNLAQEHPRRVAKMAKSIEEWRGIHPSNGIRQKLVPPPGWRAPLDWATYPVRDEELQEDEAWGMAPTEFIKKLLDFQDRERLIYE